MMTVLLNIASPLLSLIILLLFFKTLKPRTLNKVTGIAGFTLGLLTIPLVILDFHYYNWVLEYFKIPVTLISVTLIMIFSISNKYFKISTISLLSLAFLLNFTYQYILIMAQMSGSLKPLNCPDFAPAMLTHESYNLVKGGGYFIHETKINGKIYREVSHRWNLNPDCQTVFNLYNSNKSIIYDSCNNELIINK